MVSYLFKNIFFVDSDDFELIFLSEVRLMDVWSKYPGGSIGLEDDYTAPHLTLREECFLPRTWDTESP